MPFQKDEFTDDGSSQTSLHDLQHTGLEEAQLLQQEIPTFTRIFTSRKFSERISQWQCLIYILQAAFFLSTIVCMWIIAFQSLQAVPGSKQIYTSPKSEADGSVSSGFGERGFTLAEDISGQVPKLNTQLWMFWNDSKFQIEDPRRATHEDEVSLRKAWESIVPGILPSEQYRRWLETNSIVKEGNGFITIEKPESPVLPPPINRPAGSDMDRFCLTVFHQLHCLRGIQEAFYKFVKDPSTEPELGHFNHCVDYLREGIMCYSDTALEGQSTYSSKERANGNGSNHVCKNFEKILDWANTRSSKRLSRLHNGHIPNA